MIHALFLIAMSTSLTSQFTLVREGEPFTLRVAKPALTRASFVVNVDPAGEEAERTPSSVEWYSSDGKKKGSAYALSKPNEIILGVLGNNTIQLTRQGSGTYARKQDGTSGPFVAFPKGTDMLLEVSEDGKTYVFSGDDKLVVKDANGERSLPPFGKHVGSPALSPDGKELAVSSDDTVVIYEMADLKERCRFRLADANEVNTNVRFSASSKHLAVTTQQGFYIYDVSKTPKEMISLPKAGYFADWRDEKGLVLTTPGFQSIKVWDATDGHLVKTIETGEGQCHGVYLLEGGRIVSVQNGKEVRLYKL